jgi:chromate transporter
MGELVAHFLCLGLMGFGGPVALVGQMERELVAERQWLGKDPPSLLQLAWVMVK